MAQNQFDAPNDTSPMGVGKPVFGGREKKKQPGFGARMVDTAKNELGNLGTFVGDQAKFAKHQLGFDEGGTWGGLHDVLGAAGQTGEAQGKELADTAKSVGGFLWHGNKPQDQGGGMAPNAHGVEMDRSAAQPPPLSTPAPVQPTLGAVGSTPGMGPESRRLPMPPPGTARAWSTASPELQEFHGAVGTPNHDSSNSRWAELTRKGVGGGGGGSYSGGGSPDQSSFDSLMNYGVNKSMHDEELGEASWRERTGSDAVTRMMQQQSMAHQLSRQPQTEALEALKTLMDPGLAMTMNTPEGKALIHHYLQQLTGGGGTSPAASGGAASQPSPTTPPTTSSVPHSLARGAARGAIDTGAWMGAAKAVPPIMRALGMGSKMAGPMGKVAGFALPLGASYLADWLGEKGLGAIDPGFEPSQPAYAGGMAAGGVGAAMGGRALQGRGATPQPQTPTVPASPPVPPTMGGVGATVPASTGTGMEMTTVPHGFTHSPGSTMTTQRPPARPVPEERQLGMGELGTPSPGMGSGPWGGPFGPTQQAQPTIQLPGLPSSTPNPVPPPENPMGMMGPPNPSPRQRVGLALEGARREGWHPPGEAKPGGPGAPESGTTTPGGEASTKPATTPKASGKADKPKAEKGKGKSVTGSLGTKSAPSNPMKEFKNDPQIEKALNEFSGRMGDTGAPPPTPTGPPSTLSLPGVTSTMSPEQLARLKATLNKIGSAQNVIKWSDVNPPASQ